MHRVLVETCVLYSSSSVRMSTYSLVIIGPVESNWRMPRPARVRRRTAASGTLVHVVDGAKVSRNDARDVDEKAEEDLEEDGRMGSC